MKAVDKILDTFNVVDEKIREKVKELIEKGGVKITEVKERVLEILENLGVSVAADEGTRLMRLTCCYYLLRKGSFGN